MKQIRDILCYQTGYGEMYSTEDASIGRIVIQEDHSFEGFIEDYGFSTRYFVFGKINPEEGMELVKCRMYDKEIPKLYRGKQEGNRFYGDYLAKSSFAEVELGECKVTVLNPDSYREVGEIEIETLEQETKRFHDSLGQESSQIYAQMMNSKKEEKQKKYAQN